ncbi:olfactory receptor 24 [Biomphalaria glabrata]
MFVPLALYLTFVPDTPYYNNCCKYLSFFALWSLSTGGNFLVVIAMDRFLKLCLLRKSGIEPAIVKKIIFGLALYTGLLNIPVTLLFTRDETPMVFYQVKAVYCFLDLRTELVILMEFFSYYSMVSISGVALTLIILYGKIILKLRELSFKHKELKGKTAGASEEAAKGNRQSRVMLKSSLVFIAVTAAYFGCFTPYGIVVIMENVRFLQAHQLSPLTKALYDLCKLSPTLTHMLNPLIFIFSSDRFMAEVKAIVLCRSSFRYCCVRRQNV